MVVIRNADHYLENYNSCAKYKKANDSSWNAPAFFPSDMTQGQCISLQMSWKVKVKFFTICFFTDKFWTKNDRYKIRTASCSSRQDASKHTCWHWKAKFNLRSRSRRDPSCICVDAYWRNKHIETFFMSLSLLNLKLSTKNCCDTWWPQTT